MTDSKEYSTVVNCRRKLEIALKSDRDIAQFLHQQRFITQECYDEVNNPKSNLTDADKASMLVTAIRNRVELNHHNYHKLVNHLRQNIMRYGDIIKILDQEYHQTGNFQPAAKLQSSNPTPHLNSESQPNIEPAAIAKKFPFLKSEDLRDEEMNELVSRLIAESEIIRKEFTFLVLKTEQSLDSKNIPVKKLILTLKNINREHSAIDKLKSKSDICDAFIELTDHWSFFDFEILSLFIEVYCSNDPDLTKCFNDYKLHFRQYCERRLYEVPIESFSAEVSQKEHTYLHVKLDEIFNKDIKQLKLKDIEQLNRSISHILKTSVRLVQIEEGCIELIYITLCEFDETFHLSDQQSHELKEMGIIKIYAKKDDECVFIGEKNRNRNSDSLLSSASPTINPADQPLASSAHTSSSTAFKMSSHPHKFEVEGAINAGPVGGKAKVRSESENPSPQGKDTLHKQVGVGATTGAVAVAGVGVGIGAVIGSVVGSVLPGFGTIIGATMGAAIGAAIGGGAVGGAIHHAVKDKKK